MKIIEKKTSDLIPYANNPRHNDDAVQYVANSIKDFGFKVPIVIDTSGVIVCGHTRLKAAKLLKLDTVPCVVADDLTPEQIQAFRLADNKVSEAAKRPDREHAITLDNMGFASSYVHGQAHSVMIGHVNKGDLVVHNHPGGGSFSDADLINTASDRRSRGIVATYDKGLFGRGYRVVTKGTHFNAEGFTRAVKSARLRGKDYDDAADKWLTRNQKKYGYKFKHVKL